MSAIEQELKDCRATYDALAQKYKALEAQRDKLADTLRWIVRLFGTYDPKGIQELKDEVQIARSLLARLEGGQRD